MKATGIVRRIDDLGRVVIPKEIRRTLRIREGDPLEIFTDAGGEVIFKKYSPIGELSGFAVQCAEALADATKLGVIVCDRDHCIAAAGVSKKEVLERRVTPVLEGVMEDRKTKVFESENQLALEGVNRRLCLACPIIISGDVSGAVAMVASDSMQKSDEADEKLAQVAAGFLSKHLES